MQKMRVARRVAHTIYFPPAVLERLQKISVECGLPFSKTVVVAAKKGLRQTEKVLGNE